MTNNRYPPENLAIYKFKTTNISPACISFHETFSSLLPQCLLLLELPEEIKVVKATVIFLTCDQLSRETQAFPHIHLCLCYGYSTPPCRVFSENTIQCLYGIFHHSKHIICS